MSKKVYSYEYMNAMRAYLTCVAMALAAIPAGNAVAGDAAYGEYLSGECVTCHRTDGAASNIPDITGWDEEGFYSVLVSYRDKTREHAAMQTIAARLGEEEMRALAAYFASLGKPHEHYVSGNDDNQ